MYERIAEDGRKSVENAEISDAKRCNDICGADLIAVKRDV